MDRPKKYNVKPTEKQQKIVEFVKENPNATLEQIRVNSGYTSLQHTHRALNSDVVKKSFAALMEEDEDLSDISFREKLKEGLNAYKRDPAGPENIPDFDCRHKWWMSGMRLKGYYKDEDSKPQSQILIINALQESNQKGISE